MPQPLATDQRGSETSTVYIRRPHLASTRSNLPTGASLLCILFRFLTSKLASASSRLS